MPNFDPEELTGAEQMEPSVTCWKLWNKSLPLLLHPQKGDLPGRMAPHSCLRSLISAILHKRSASSQTVYRHITRGWLQQSYPGTSPVISAKPKSNGYNDATINVLNVMPLEFKLLQGCRRRNVPPVSIFWRAAEANLYPCFTRVGAAIIHFAQNLFFPTSAVQWRLHLGHTLMNWMGWGHKGSKGLRGNHLMGNQ